MSWKSDKGEDMLFIDWLFFTKKGTIVCFVVPTTIYIITALIYNFG